jgi:hypothetical protein
MQFAHKHTAFCEDLNFLHAKVKRSSCWFTPMAKANSVTFFLILKQALCWCWGTWALSYREDRLCLIWMWLKVISGCLQTVTVTESERQQLDKEIWGCLLSCCEKMRKVSDCIFHDIFSYSCKYSVIKQGCISVIPSQTVAALNWFQ